MTPGELEKKAYAEGFRAAQEQANKEKGLEWAQGYQVGFMEARDKAKRTVEEWPLGCSESEIARRIGSLEP